jgi:signal transduction histidine kinase
MWCAADNLGMSHELNNTSGGASGPDPRVVRPPGVLAPSDPSSGPAGADQLTVLAHDLSNMIDGSMRWLGLAIAAMPEGSGSDPGAELAAARRQIETVHATLHRMSSLVGAAMRSATVPIGSPMLGVSESVTIGMAIDHAIDVVRPLASQSGVRIEAHIEPGAGAVAAGPVYSVILNGLFNAAQSIERSQRRDPLDPSGSIRVNASLVSNGDELQLDIVDDGQGLGNLDDVSRCFEHGFSCREDGAGLGLAMSKQIVESLEGVIELVKRDDTVGHARPGAILRIRIPTQQPSHDRDRLIG